MIRICQATLLEVVMVQCMSSRMRVCAFGTSQKTGPTSFVDYSQNFRIPALYLIYENDFTPYADISTF